MYNWNRVKLESKQCQLTTTFAEAFWFAAVTSYAMAVAISLYYMIIGGTMVATRHLLIESILIVLVYELNNFTI